VSKYNATIADDVAGTTEVEKHCKQILFKSIEKQIVLNIFLYKFVESTELDRTLRA
jgi:hypothetical protein